MIKNTGTGTGTGSLKILENCPVFLKTGKFKTGHDKIDLVKKCNSISLILLTKI